MQYCPSRPSTTIAAITEAISLLRLFPHLFAFIRFLFQEGKLTIKHELCPLAKAVDHVVDIVSPLARKDVAIERHVDPRTPLIIADFSRVIQVDTC